MSLDDETSAFALKSDINVEEEAEKNIRIELLREALGELSAADRTLIHEYFFENLSLRQLAKKYGMSHTYLHGQIKDILVKLRQNIITKLK